MSIATNTTKLNELLASVNALPEAPTAQEKTVTPTTAQQIVAPDEGTDYLSQVTVAAIPYSEESNSAGGVTVTIGG